MNRTISTTKFGAKIVIVIIVILVGLQIYYKIEQNTFSNQLFNMELPEGIELLEKQQVKGKLNGNGNSMDFLACILVKTDKNQDELERILNNKIFSPVREDEEEEYNNVYREVVKVDGTELKTKCLEHKSIFFEELDGVTEFDGYYALLIYDGGYTTYLSFFD